MKGLLRRIWSRYVMCSSAHAGQLGEEADEQWIFPATERWLVPLVEPLDRQAPPERRPALLAEEQNYGRIT